MRGPKIGKLDSHPMVDNSVPQHIHRAARVQLLHQPLLERLLSIVLPAIQRDEPFPLILLSHPDKRQRQPKVESDFGVESVSIGLLVSTVLDQ
jgi:hypothetical protein